jgi:hypothetical protein
MREAAVAGLATRLLATGQVSKESLRWEKIMRVSVDGDADRNCALVDGAVLADRFVRARTLWRPEGISEIFVASASPDAVGLSSVVGLLSSTPRFTPYGLHLGLTDPSEAETAPTVPLVPGLVAPVGMAEKRRMQPG